jgi:hypothetical protein
MCCIWAVLHLLNITRLVINPPKQIDIKYNVKGVMGQIVKASSPYHSNAQRNTSLECVESFSLWFDVRVFSTDIGLFSFYFYGGSSNRGKDTHPCNMQYTHQGVQNIRNTSSFHDVD